MNEWEAQKDRVEAYLRWIDSDVLTIRDYHDHKEQLTWKVAAFYLPAVVTVANVAAASAPCGWQKLGVALMMLSAWGLAVAFMRTLFSARWRAHDEIVGLERARGKLIADPKGVLDSAGVAVEDPSDRKVTQYPVFIQTELDGSRTYWREQACRSWESVRIGEKDEPDKIRNKWYEIRLRVIHEVVLHLILLASTVLGILWMLTKVPS